MPSASLSRAIRRDRIQPPATPVSAPRPSWLTSISANPPALACSMWSSISTMPVTSRMAIGSLAPDSISRVDCTRSLRRTPLLRSSANTAAASVEPTIEASSRPSRQSTSSSQVANTPSSAAVPITPQVARIAAGRKATRKLAALVRKPPSSRITASASWPMRLAMKKSLKAIPPGPSTPASMPMTRNSSSRGRPRRAETVLASTLTKSSTAARRKRALIAVIAGVWWGRSAPRPVGRWIRRGTPADGRAARAARPAGAVSAWGCRAPGLRRSAPARRASSPPSSP